VCSECLKENVVCILSVKAACAFCAAAALLARSDTQSIPRSLTPCCKRPPRSHTPCRLSAEQGEDAEEWLWGGL